MTPADEEALNRWISAVNDRFHLVERRLWLVSLTGLATALTLMVAVLVLR